MARTSIRIMLTLAALGALPSAAWGQASWRPEKAVEIVITTAPGGSNDQVARLIQKIWQDEKLVDFAGADRQQARREPDAAVVYLTQHAGDPHFLLMANPTVITNHIAGITPLNPSEFTPIALLLIEHTAISVRADSPIRNIQDLVTRLKADPESMTLGIVARGGVNHLAVSQAVRRPASMPASQGGRIQDQRRIHDGAGGRAYTVRRLFREHGDDPGGDGQRAPHRDCGIPAHERPACWRAHVQGARHRVLGLQLARDHEPERRDAGADRVLGRSAGEDGRHRRVEEADGSARVGRPLPAQPEFAKYLEGEYAAAKAIMAELGLAKQ